MFTKEELQTIFALINRANITGSEAMPVAILQQKIKGLLTKEQDEKGTKEEAS